MKQGIHPSVLCVLVAWWLSALLTGCGGLLEVGIERTPTPDVAPAATIDALRSENAQLTARVTAQVTPTPAPPRLGRVAYVQGGDIWIKVLPNGVRLRLTTDGRNREPLWSPSGQVLAFRKDRYVTVEQEVPCEVPRSRSTTCTESVTVLQKQVWKLIHQRLRFIEEVGISNPEWDLM